MYTKTADEIAAQNPDLAIIPVGSLEQHGPHLPVMTTGPSPQSWASG